MSRGLGLARAIGWKRSPASDDGENTSELSMESLVENALAQRIGQGPLSRITSLEADGNFEESESPATAEGGTVATIGETRKSVTTAAINAIEDDIASLLATMNSEGGADDGIDAEDATLALLGELDRLWSADPMVCASSAA